MIKRIVKEPLLHFLLLGALIFVVYQWRQEENTASVIRVDSATVTTLANQYRKTWLMEPTREALQTAIDNHVANQLYADQAFALGMHLDDPVVARRMRMKMELLSELDIAPPSEDDIGAYFDQHRDKYKQGGRHSFQHRFLDRLASPERRREMEAALSHGNGVRSDASLFADQYDNASDHQISRAFGTGFLDQLYRLPLDQWVGPLESPLGWHFVNISQRLEPPLPMLEQVREAVVRDALQAKREQAKRDQFQQLINNNKVIIEWPKDLK